MRLLLVVTLVVMAGCSGKRESKNFAEFTGEYLYGSLAMSPVAATSVGYHVHEGKRLDEQWDDYSAQGLERQRNFYRDLLQRLNSFAPESLDAQEQADRVMIEDQVRLALLELDTIQNYRHNPTVYVELIGNGLFTCYSLEYAPKPERYKQIIARLNGVTALLNQAKANLADAPEVWNRVAREENDGNIGLVDQVLRAGAPAEVKAEYDRAADAALPALRGFSEWLAGDLSKRTSDWRLGKEKYAQKFRHVLEVERTPEQVLAEAEADLTAVRRQMFELSLPLHRRFYPKHRDPVDPEPDRRRNAEQDRGKARDARHVHAGREARP